MGDWLGTKVHCALHALSLARLAATFTAHSIHTTATRVYAAPRWRALPRDCIKPTDGFLLACHFACCRTAARLHEAPRTKGLLCCCLAQQSCCWHSKTRSLHQGSRACSPAAIAEQNKIANCSPRHKTGATFARTALYLERGKRGFSARSDVQAAQHTPCTL